MSFFGVFFAPFCGFCLMTFIYIRKVDPEAETLSSLETLASFNIE